MELELKSNTFQIGAVVYFYRCENTYVGRIHEFRLNVGTGGK